MLARVAILCTIWTTVSAGGICFGSTVSVAVVFAWGVLARRGRVGGELAAGRGPGMNGISAEKGIPLKWSPTENIAWKLAMPGRSGSTPIIWGERIFLNIGTADGGGDLELWALDRADGKVLWKRNIAGGNHRKQKQNMSSPSPVTDGQTVWVMTGVGVLRPSISRQGALDARHPEGLRPVRPELRLRVVAAASQRRAVRASASRHEHRRSVLRAAARRQVGKDRVAGGAAHRRHHRVTGFVHDAGGAAITAAFQKGSSW